MAQSSTNQTPHFILIPWLAQGHMMPMLDIARLLASRGVTVTVITTPANAARIKPNIDRISHAGLPIRFTPLPFPSAEFGLPDGCENLDSIPSMSMVATFCRATKRLKDPLVLHLRRAKSAPSCIVAGFGHAWAADVAEEFGIPRLFFQGFSCFSTLSFHNLHTSMAHEAVGSDSEPFPLPGLPRRFEITRSQLPIQFRPSPPEQEEVQREIREAELTADGILVNSFDDLEPGYAGLLEKAAGKKAWMTGPVALSSQSAVDDRRCLSWLDSRSPKSVVYVCFGSMGGFPPSQLKELGSGLLASGRPFIWVIKGREEAPEVEKWLSDKFGDERRCFVIRGWAPQVAILSHPAVGGFVTHCGWNSTLEGVSAGVPMVTWPMFAEQFLNEKLVVEVMGIGVSLGVKKPTHFAGAVEDEVAVRGEVVAEAVGRLMGGGEEGEERRRRAEQLGVEATRAMEEGGSSYLNLTSLIQYVIKP